MTTETKFKPTENKKFSEPSSKMKKTEIGLIPEDWEVKELQDIADYNSVKINLDEVKIEQYISTENLLPNKAGITLAQTFPKTGKLNKFQKKDILFSNIRTYFKKLWFANFNGACSNDVLVIRNKKEVNPLFLFYYLSQNLFFNYTVGTSKGTKMPRGDKKAIMQFNINLPPLPEQKAIAKILSDLDSKIELFQKQNETLEKIGKAIFKHWFVDFEFPNEKGKPYKSSGGKMVGSEMGEIPEGWEILKFGELFNLMMGLSPKGDSYNSDTEGTPLINGAADFKNGGIEPTKYTTQPTRVCKEGDLLFCIRGTIGNLTYADKEYCLGRGVASISPKKNEYKEFIYYKLLQKMTEMISKASGSVIIGLSKPDINDTFIAVSCNGIINKYHDVVENLLIKKEKDSVVINNLQKTRDLLLPKLMSGKIRVPLKN